MFLRVDFDLFAHINKLSSKWNNVEYVDGGKEENSHMTLGKGSNKIDFLLLLYRRSRPINHDGGVMIALL